MILNMMSGGSGSEDFYVVVFKNPVDESVYQYVECEPGGSVVYSGKEPTRDSPEIEYTFTGWTSTKGGSAEADILNNIEKNKIVWAAYTEKKKEFEVTWKNYDGVTLKTENYSYGVVPSYGSNPSYGNHTFAGWNPVPSSISESMTYYATYSLPKGMSETISKSWREVIADAKASNTSGYSEGATKVMLLSDGGALCYEIAGLKKDSDSTFSLISRTTDGSCQWSGQGSSTNGYPKSTYKTELESTCLNHMPNNVKEAMKTVTKYCYTLSNKDLSYTAKIWPPSFREMAFTGGTYETQGPQYSYYNSNSKRIRYNSVGAAQVAWLSSASSYDNKSVCIIQTDGNYYHIARSSNLNQMLPCFCL